jgi:hypothetical protein
MQFTPTDLPSAPHPSTTASMTQVRAARGAPAMSTSARGSPVHAERMEHWSPPEALTCVASPGFRPSGVS